jgi:predicted transposase YbfD/YdcC
MSRIAPEEIERCFMNWVRAIKKEYEREIIAIDGKTVRGYFKTGGEALHIVSAWATENRLVFGQVKTEEKSNEITAIPKLLEHLALEGCIVTIDAMGRQHKIARDVVRKKADYLFSLKANQETLYEDVKEYFEGLDFSASAGKNRNIQFHSASTHDERHGRIEDRDYAVSEDVGRLVERRPEWKAIRSMGVVESSREVKGARIYYEVFDAPPSEQEELPASVWATLKVTGLVSVFPINFKRSGRSGWIEVACSSEVVSFASNQTGDAVSSVVKKAFAAYLSPAGSYVAGEDASRVASWAARQRIDYLCGN